MGKKSVITIVFVILLLALVIGVGALNHWISHGLLLCVRNDSQRTIKIIDIYYRDGSTGPMNIDAGKSFEVYLHPGGQSDLTMRYIDRDGAQVYKPIDIYLIPEWRTCLEMTIDANDIVTMKAKALP